MDIDSITLAKDIKNKFEYFKKQRQFSHIAKLITYALQVNLNHCNQQIFGYIPKIFREVELRKTPNKIQTTDLCIGEPIIYRIYYRSEKELYKIPFFYMFCYLKENSNKLNVYFQSANPKYKLLSQNEYDVSQEKISFEGAISAFSSNDLSVISISDPGHFIPGFGSSYYAGSPEINFTKLISEILENICQISEIKPQNTLLIGSSAGTFGALLSSTYFNQKVNVLSINSQIFTYRQSHLMRFCFGTDEQKILLDKFADQISCTHRFQQNINSVPNIYILANLNDNLHQRNSDFYQMYQQQFVKKGVNNQSVFDSYYGVEGHGRPEPNSLRTKIQLARKILTMKSTL
jgi:hypothetical protein